MIPYERPAIWIAVIASCAIIILAVVIAAATRQGQDDPEIELCIADGGTPSIDYSADGYKLFVGCLLDR